MPLQTRRILELPSIDGTPPAAPEDVPQIAHNLRQRFPHVDTLSNEELYTALMARPSKELQAMALIHRNCKKSGLAARLIAALDADRCVVEISDSGETSPMASKLQHILNFRGVGVSWMPIVFEEEPENMILGK